MVVGILDGGSTDLLIALIREGRLLPRLLQAFEDNEQKLKDAKPFGLGFMGHVHRICRVLLSLMSAIRNCSNEGSTTLNDMTHADSVADLLEEDAQVWKTWDALAASTLEPLYEQERHPLGGVPLTFEKVEAAYNSLEYTQEDQMRAQFAEMLGHNEYNSKEDPYEDDYDIKDSSEASMLPEILNDSSSSEDDDDFLQPHRLPVDDSAISNHAETPTSNEEVADNWANFEEIPPTPDTIDVAEGMNQAAEDSRDQAQDSVGDTSDNEARG
uniref:Serine/threonineprotein phosphatase 6 regulatory subunit putative n=1 Tax=Albugo laibachii Nc14 TaxID=890382 RepID=F0X2R3_9STRA|nr:serine/threonineprotein phosphatase 6 regulatory subunit putative [Albugo laibachii Nc14]|eukprot:CCA28204.1 serine/threonineprotein phosphatase 6 regulatory subunit putative [Albugo laibachii Nc14]